MTILRSGNSLLGPANVLEPGFRPGVRWGWCHGGVLQSVGRSEALPSTPTLPGRGPRARQFPISRSERRASSAATPPRALEGQGRTAIRGRPIGGPSGLGQTVGHAPNARHRSHRLLISDCNGRDPCSGAAPPLRRFGLALVPRLPVLDGFPAAMLRFAPPCAGADCGDPPGIDPPGSGRFCRKTGSNLTPFRGSGRLFRFLAAIRVDVYGITPGQKHLHRRCPVPQPTKPPRPLLVR